MEVITIANQKGGVGKTTSAVSIADALAIRGNRVLMLDFDPQGSLTSYLQLDPDEVTNTTYEIFSDNPEVTPFETGFENLSVVPSSSALANLEKRANTLKGKGLVLTSWLRSLRGFDYVVIDTPPALGMLMVNALVACDRLVVPVQTDHLALKGLERMVGVLAMLENSGREIPYQILPTMYDQRTNASIRALQVIKDQYPQTFDGLLVPVDTKLREASRLGVPPSFLFSNSRGVLAYNKLVNGWFQDHEAADTILESCAFLTPVESSHEFASA